MGFELNFTIGFLYGPARKRERTEFYKQTVTAYNPDGSVNNTQVFENTTFNDTTNGDIEQDETGSGTFGGGAVVILGVSYYFL